MSLLHVLGFLELHDRPLMPLQLVSDTISGLPLHQVHAETHVVCSKHMP